MLILISLPFLASPDVRDDGAALFFYTLLGTAWLGGATFLFPLLGVSVRDDVTERHNRGAGVAILGALAGVTLCFIGSNIGTGPGVDAVLFCAALATLTFFLCWLILELYASPSEQITVERDFGAGIRLAGLTTSLGIVLGSAVAGDWGSWAGTLRDFLFYGWPAILLLALALLVERNRAGQSGLMSWSIQQSSVIAILYLSVSVLFVFIRGDLL
ncbi:MAG TPA: hypothetical protein VFM21_03355 [Terriglobia bacterium]|nr:hypothetical protein [Terriglobia bacterium]